MRKGCTMENKIEDLREELHRALDVEGKELCLEINQEFNTIIAEYTGGKVINHFHCKG